jgi:hypothetical protein
MISGAQDAGERVVQRAQKERGNDPRPHQEIRTPQGIFLFTFYFNFIHLLFWVEENHPRPAFL